MQWTVQQKPWRSTMWRRTLHPSSRRRWTRSRKFIFYQFFRGPNIIFANNISVQIQSNMALHCGTQLWLLRDPWDQVNLSWFLKPLCIIITKLCWNATIRHFIYFYLGQVAVLLFKSGWMVSNRDWPQFFSYSVILCVKCSEDPNLPLISICSWKMGS